MQRACSSVAPLDFVGHGTTTCVHPVVPDRSYGDGTSWSTWFVSAPPHRSAGSGGVFFPEFVGAPANSGRAIPLGVAPRYHSQMQAPKRALMYGRGVPDCAADVRWGSIRRRAPAESRRPRTVFTHPHPRSFPNGRRISPLRVHEPFRRAEINFGSLHYEGWVMWWNYRQQYPSKKEVKGY